MSEPRPPAGGSDRNDADLDIPPIVGEVVQKTSRFSREVVATMIALATSAFGFVAALAWNTAITTSFNEAFGEEGGQTSAEVSALFIYAVVVTLVGVVVIVLLGRLATRLRTEPIEFKYPGIPKT